MAEIATKPSEPAKPVKPVKPVKPDEEQYKANLAQAEKAFELAKNRLNTVNSKLELVQANGKDSPQALKQAALRSEEAELRKIRSVHKEARQKNLDQIKRLDERLKALMTEQKTARSKVAFKSIEEIDREIERLKKRVDSGTMKIVDERKALDDVGNLHRVRKGFDGFAQQQKLIDDLKSQIADLKKSSDTAEIKSVNDRYDENQQKLNEMKKDIDHAHKNLNALRDERSQARDEKTEKWKLVREIQDNYHQARRTYREYETQQRQGRREKQEAERVAFEASKRREIADRKLEEASAPAFQEEIFTAQSIIRHFDPSDPSAVAAKEESVPGKFAAVAQRKVDDSAFAGARVVSRKKDDDEDYMVGAGKKKKGSRAARNPNNTADSSAAPANGKFNLSIDIITSLARISIDPPVSQSEVPGVITKLKHKIDGWKADQDRKTNENIAKAKKEIEQLEQEASSSSSVNAKTDNKGTSSQPTDPNQAVNGKVDASTASAQEKDVVSDSPADSEPSKTEQVDA